MSRVLDDLVEAIVKGDAARCVELVKKATNPRDGCDAVLRSLAKGMDIVGCKYEKGEYFIPEMMRSARAANCVMDHLKTLVKDGEAGRKNGTVVIGTVSGDIHDIGKNILITFLRARGFSVHDLGVNVPAERFVQEVKEKRADYLLMSAMTTATRNAMEEVIRLLEAEGYRDKVKVLIGGVSISREFARELGADGYAKDVMSTIALLQEL